MPKSSEAFDIGGFLFRPAEGELRDPEGRPITLRPQSLRVLDTLVAQAGTVVTKDAMMQAVWPDTHVTDDSLVQCISEIRKALGAEAGARLRTVPKQGYRLDAAPAGHGPASSTRHRRIWVGLAGTLGLASVLVAALLFLSREANAPAPVQQTIAVLPFNNLSGDPDQAYYSNGLAEALIVDLSKISDLRVVSRGAAFAVAQESTDPRQIARDLRVSHLVEGSVRRDRDTLRITAALIDGESGENLWANSYSGAQSEVFEFQDAVLAELVRVLSVRLSPQERKRLGVRGTEDVEAFDAYLHGIELGGFLNADDNRRAEQAFETAIRHDPDYAAAYAQLSIVLSMRAEYNWTHDIPSAIADAVRNAERAVALDPDLPFAHFALGRLLSRGFILDIDGSIAEFEKAISLDPNYTDAYAFYAIIQNADGRAEDALATITEAFDRNPAPPYWYFIPFGLSNFYLGNYAEAEAAFTELLDRNPNSPHALRLLMATYGYLDRADDAQWLAMEYEMLGIPATIGDIMKNAAVDHPTYRAAFAEGLRRAGLPE